jgi:hypothetical protein
MNKRRAQKQLFRKEVENPEKYLGDNGELKEEEKKNLDEKEL